MMFEGLVPPLAFAGVAWSRAGQDLWKILTAPGLTVTPKTMFRVASISKVVIGKVLDKVMASEGVAHPYQMDVRGVLPLPPNPHDTPSQKVTFGQLASHTSGLADLMVPPDVSLFDFLAKTSNVWSASPGTRFEYSNLGYVVLAAALEAATGRRMDHLAADVLKDLGIDGGLNWSGVGRADRGAALPTYRRDKTGFLPQIDARVPEDGVIGADGYTFDLTRYRPGWNPACFAPQGGLRTSLQGLLTLAKSLNLSENRVIWRKSDGAGHYLDGLFCDYGAGLQILPNPPFYPRPLIGHFANAYGFRGGVWYDASADLSFAYALNGFPIGDEDDALSGPELTILQSLSELDPE